MFGRAISHDRFVVIHAVRIIAFIREQQCAASQRFETTHVAAVSGRQVDGAIENNLAVESTS